MSNTTERFGNQAKETADDFVKTGRIVTDAVQEKLGQLGDQADVLLKQGQDNVHGFACACEQFVRTRPIRSVVIAAAAGWLLGRFWKR